MLAQAIRNPAALGPDAVRVDAAAQAAFPLLVPESFLALARSGEVCDPILAQILPRAEEALDTPGFSDDPLAEDEVQPVPGLLHRYRNRVLMILSEDCALHCRFCFRRHRLGTGLGIRAHWPKALAWLRGHPEVVEVILSGGDPLMLDDDDLGRVLDDLEAIGSVRFLRFHTRLPVAIPARVQAGLLTRLAGRRPALVMVLHVNHAVEVSRELKLAVRRLTSAGVQVLSQSVLLAGVNDSLPALTGLCLALGEAGIMPYYLHLLDPVAGAAHFVVGEAQAMALHRDLRAVLPGHLVPRLAQEVPGEPCKRILA